MMRMTLIAVAVVAALGGCATAEETYTPTGQRGYSVDCSNTQSWSGCYEKAGELCAARGYTVLDKGGDQDAAIGASQYGLFGHSSPTRSLLIQCN